MNGVFRTALPLTSGDEVEIDLLRRYPHSTVPVIEPVKWYVSAGKFIISKIKLIKRFPSLYDFLLKAFRKFPTKVKMRLRRLYVKFQVSGSSFHKSLPYSFDLGFGISTSSEPLVSILIPVHNNSILTLNCLRSIQRCCDKSLYEVIVINDFSTDSTEDLLENIRGINVLHLQKNVGFLNAINLGSDYAKGKYLMILNNDTLVTSGWLDSLVEVLDSDSKTVIVGSKLLNMNGSLQEAGGMVFSNGNAWNLGRNDNPIEEKYNFRREVDYVSGASFLVRKYFWDEHDGFDEIYTPAYYEDTDLCTSAWADGFKVMYEPKSVVFHIEGGSHGKNLMTGLKAYQKINKLKFENKWKSFIIDYWVDGTPRYEYSRKSRGIFIVIDNQLPVEYRDGGSRRTLEIIRAIQNAGFHIILTCLNPNISLDQITKLRNQGIEVYPDFSNFFEAISGRSDRITGVWAIRDSVVTAFREKIKFLAPNCHFIVDLLDLDYRIDSNGSIEISSKHLSLPNLKDKTVLVSKLESQLLMNRLAGLDVETLWMPFHTLETAEVASFENRSGILFVGGFRHYPNEEGLEWFIENVMPEIKLSGFNENIYAIGSGMPSYLRKMCEESGIKYVGRVDEIDNFYRKVKLSIAPLLSGRGKKVKVGESLSQGVPIIGTNIAFEDFDFQGVLSNTEVNSIEEWVTAILRFTSDANSWREVSTSSIKYAQQELSQETFRKKILSIINS